MATVVEGKSIEPVPMDAVAASGGESSTTEKPATDDATLLEKTQKAMKQGVSSSSLFLRGGLMEKFIVEFYFADANLPYDKFAGF